MSPTSSDEPTSYADSYDDVSMYSLADQRESQLLSAQTECTFMNFVAHEGRFWLTCTRRRKRVAAVEARPRVAVAVSSRGTDIGISQAVTYKGVATVHDDAATKAWFYPLLAAKVRPGNDAQQAAFVTHLDTPGRIVIEIVPTTRIGFDAENMFRNSPAGSTSTKV
jgi:Pyridoxamine 5'-phosphate oxidase